MGCPAMLWWISAFGQPLGQIGGPFDGRRVAGQRRGSADRRGPITPSSARRPSSSQVPSTMSPPGASRGCIVRQDSITASSGYWRRTLNARTRIGRRPASSKPPTRNSTVLSARSCSGGLHPLRVDLQADHPHVGPHRLQARRQFQRGDGQPARSPGRPPPVRQPIAALSAPEANASASGRPGATGWLRSFPGSACRPGVATY